MTASRRAFHQGVHVLTLRKILSLVLSFTLSSLSAATLAAQTPPSSGATSGASAPDPWPQTHRRRKRHRGDDVPRLPAPARQLVRRHARGPLRRLGPAPGSEGSDVRRHLVHGAHRRGQGQPRRLPRGHEHHAGQLPVRRPPRPRPGRPRSTRASRARSPRRSRSTASQADLGIVQQRKVGESRPLNNAPPQIVFSEVPAVLVLIDGAPVWKPQASSSLQRLINTSAIVLKASDGDMYFHLFDGWLKATSLQGPWEVTDPHPRTKARSRRGLQSDPGGRERRPDDRRLDVRQERAEAVAEDEADAGRLHGDAADGAGRRQRPAQLRPDPGHAAALRHQHDRARLQGHRQPEHVRPDRGALVQRARTRPDRGRTWRPPACRRTSRRSRTRARWRTSRPRCPERQQSQEAIVASSIPQTATVQRTAQIAKPITFDGSPEMKPIEGTTPPVRRQRLDADHHDGAVRRTTPARPASGSRRRPSTDRGRSRRGCRPSIYSIPPTLSALLT